MQFTPTDVEGCFVVDLQPITDERGFFARAWCSAETSAVGAADNVAQVNMSRSAVAGMIRGLHWQVDPHGEAKFVRCIAGRIFDVCVDMRPDSPTYLRWAGVELTPQNRRAFSVPAGCAHGYQAVDADSEVIYLVSTPYVPGAENGLRWDDPSIGITWPITEGVVVSDKDANWPLLER
jgi:dTDP-4-dehydrorhamnose 3,5-epimerase